MADQDIPNLDPIEGGAFEALIKRRNSDDIKANIHRMSKTQLNECFEKFAMSYDGRNDHELFEMLLEASADGNSICVPKTKMNLFEMLGTMGWKRGWLINKDEWRNKPFLEDDGTFEYHHGSIIWNRFNPDQAFGLIDSRMMENFYELEIARMLLRYGVTMDEDLLIAQILFQVLCNMSGWYRNNHEFWCREESKYPFILPSNWPVTTQVRLFMERENKKISHTIYEGSYEEILEIYTKEGFTPDEYSWGYIDHQEEVDGPNILTLIVFEYDFPNPDEYIEQPEQGINQHWSCPHGKYTGRGRDRVYVEPVKICYHCWRRYWKYQCLYERLEPMFIKLDLLREYQQIIGKQKIVDMAAFFAQEFIVGELKIV